MAHSDGESDEDEVIRKSPTYDELYDAFKNM